MITTQAELDAAPLRTWIDLGPGYFTVRKDQWFRSYAGSVVFALAGSYVDAYAGSQVNAYNGSVVIALDGSRVYDWDPEKGWVERWVRRSRVEGPEL